jgi:CheY-like chemotaxis protein
MTMPHLTGADLAMQIRKIRPDIPIILCTGYSSSINENKAKAMGINAFMAKPLTTRELAKRLREVLDSSGLQHG